MTAEGKNEALEVAAYTALKAEQSSRIGLRDNYALTYAASVATLFFSSYAAKTIIPLLAVPPVTYIGMHAYATNDHRISRIRSFLRQQLPPSLARTWESSHNQPTLMIRIRSLLRFISAIFLFVGPAVTSCVSIFLLSTRTVVTVASALITVISLLLIAITFAALYVPSESPTNTQPREKA